MVPSHDHKPLNAFWILIVDVFFSEFRHLGEGFQGFRFCPLDARSGWVWTENRISPQNYPYFNRPGLPTDPFRTTRDGRTKRALKNVIVIIVYDVLRYFAVSVGSCYVLVCFLLCFAMFCCVFLCFAMFCYMFCYASLCFTLFCYVVPSRTPPSGPFQPVPQIPPGPPVRPLGL